jgi:formimidoylglutamate deiminase
MQCVLDNLNLNERFHLVHATHLDNNELALLAKSGARVVLCPSTEGNLGDGIFRMKEYVSMGGRWSIGTDSHIGINPIEEFRMIDYRQRLITNQRNTIGGDAAHYLINEEIESGRKAMGSDAQDNFEIGKPLDAVVFDAQSPLLASTSLKNLAATIVYTTDSNSALGTLVNGKWTVKFNRHFDYKKIKSDFGTVMRQIANR